MFYHYRYVRTDSFESYCFHNDTNKKSYRILMSASVFSRYFGAVLRLVFRKIINN